MNRTDLKALLVSFGIPAENAEFMASQLEKRAQQLSEKNQKSYEESLEHLVLLLKQGWAAKHSY